MTEPATTTATEPKITVLAAGDTVYAIPDPAVAQAQYLVLVGSNLDVTRYKIAAARWPDVRAKLLAVGGAEIVDLTKPAATDQDPPTDQPEGQ